MKQVIYLSGILILVVSISLDIHADNGIQLLVNPDFEGAFVQYGSFRTAIVAEGWTPWWQPQGRADPAWRNRMPEFKPAAPYANRIRSGSNAQQLFTFHGTHVGGVYQVVDGLKRGDRVQFAIWGQAWASDGDDPARSRNGGPMRMRAGIDPTGATSPYSIRVVWSEEGNPLDVWQLFVIEAVAQSSRITVFTWSSPEHPTRHNDVYWDDASLIVVESSTPPPPTWTATPWAAATRLPTATAMRIRQLTPTRAVQATPTPAYTPTAAGEPAYTPTAAGEPAYTLTPAPVYTPTAAGEPAYTPTAASEPVYTPTAAGEPAYTLTPAPVYTPTAAGEPAYTLTPAPVYTPTAAGEPAYTLTPTPATKAIRAIRLSLDIGIPLVIVIVSLLLFKERLDWIDLV